MDHEYLRSHRIVERYMAGELTVREARQFEKFCLENPQILNQLPIPVRLKARLAKQPLEDSETGMFPAIPSTATHIASGIGYTAEQDEDDDDGDDDTPARSQRPVVFWLVVAAIAASGWIMYALNSRTMTSQVRTVQAESKAIEVRAPASVANYRIAPSKVEPREPTLALGWPNPPQLLELTFDMSDTQFNTFLITIDKVNAARIVQIRRLARDSNKEFRLSLNSSAFGPGIYSIKIEGYTWRGDTVLVGWAKLGLQ